MSTGWSDELAALAHAAASAEVAGIELEQLLEELALVLQATLPRACVVERERGGRRAIRRLQVLDGNQSFTCERRPDGSWQTSVAVLQGNVTGAPRTLPSDVWVRTIGDRIRRRASEQERLAGDLRSLLGD